MKKIIIAFFVSLLTFFNISYGYTEEFKLLIDVMGIPEINFNSKSINEEIYNEYSLFVYGSPIDGYNGQRFKEVDEGHWTQNAGVWQGHGTRGEYWILRRKSKRL